MVTVDEVLHNAAAAAVGGVGTAACPAAAGRRGSCQSYEKDRKEQPVLLLVGEQKASCFQKGQRLLTGFQPGREGAAR